MWWDAKTLNVHHVIYDSKRQLWDYDFNELIVLCEDCHKNWHSEVNDLLTQIAYLKTNCNQDSWHTLELLLMYYEFEPDDFNELLRKAKEYKYPWNNE